MCGIFGILYHGKKSTPDESLLKQPAKLMTHRGPDYSGIYNNNGIGLVHTRLSILDLNPRSNQPFWDASGRYALVYNGEIYNFKELRTELVRNGYEFVTSSDTEVLLYYLIAHKGKSLYKLQGMFAFGLYDSHENSLLLARDRFGIKPLYYSEGTEYFTFSSEQKVLLNWIDKELDPLSISSYVQGFGGPHKRHSFYKHISILPPGCVMRINNGRCSEKEQYFSLAKFWNSTYHYSLDECNDNQLVDKMDELLQASIQRHMISDTPVGALCSGGVDSSIVMALATKVSSNLAIFHADVVGRNSEKDAAIQLSKHLGLDLNVVSVTDSDFIAEIPKITYHYGQPFIYHPNSVPFLKVTELVKQHNVKAILTGEAADECYLGYSYLPTEDIIAQFNNRLSKLRKYISRIAPIDRILFQNNFSYSKLSMNLHNRFEIDVETKQLMDEIKSHNGHNVDNKDYKTLRLLGYHLRTLLHRNDALGMASSIEARFPFLDHDLVGFAVNLPYRAKIRKSLYAYGEKKHPFIVSKWIIRKLADRYLPRTLSMRPKQGFPTDAFERMKIHPDLFKDSFISDFFNLTASESEYLGNSASDEFKLRLMLLDVWGRINVHDHDLEHISQDLRKYIQIH